MFRIAVVVNFMSSFGSFEGGSCRQYCQNVSRLDVAFWFDFSPFQCFSLGRRIFSILEKWLLYAKKIVQVPINASTSVIIKQTDFFCQISFFFIIIQMESPSLESNKKNVKTPLNLRSKLKLFRSYLRCFLINNPEKKLNFFLCVSTRKSNFRSITSQRGKNSISDQAIKIRT